MKHRGIYRKYEVRRCNDPEGKHGQCKYFVLDLTHDEYAMAALRAYAKACRGGFQKLASDLDAIRHGDRSPLKKLTPRRVLSWFNRSGYSR